MAKIHQYELTTLWTGNEGQGTTSYRSYNRSYIISLKNKENIYGSSDPAFLGDPTKHNPEELLLASLSSCHMLWYLHFCAEAGLIVSSYKDLATGIMIEEKNGSGYFKEVHLHPEVNLLNENKTNEAIALHKKANQYCFISNSVNFPVYHHPLILSSK